ncbi:MAG: D-2-hydroxyacid dehydrogenase family protein [Hyphomicrobiaceae bacterium]|nr:D-2-hydroxyacid dehydrogenase family protein [Hyphomicrobiaceae bacterium]
MAFNRVSQVTILKSINSGRPKIAILDDWQHIAEAEVDWSPLMARADVRFFHQPFPSEDATVEALVDFDAILAMRERTPFPPSVLDRLPRLRFFNMTGRRARGLDDIVKRGITVAITGGGESGEDTAEHALALMLASARRVTEGDASIRAGHFQDGVAPGTRLAGKTIGILGLGLIGERMAGYCNALGMRVLAYSRSMTADRAQRAGVEPAGIDDIFERSDVVSIHLVLSAETRNLVGRTQLSSMRDGAVLINTSRAQIVDEEALLAALTTGKLRAALDVFHEEPLPADHPLRTAPNTVLTPHVGYGTREIYSLFYRNSLENTLAFLDGTPIRLYAPQLHQV